jgi:polyisoprenoid-binding protein YceI
MLPQGLWRVDPARSQVGFAVRKLGTGTVHGRFHTFHGTIAIDAAGMTAAGAARVASVTTANEDRDAHLRGPAFFAADAFPEIVFRAARAARLADMWQIAGELTIRDRTRAISLMASPQTLADGALQLRVRGELDRRDFGLRWSRAVEASGVVATTIRLELDLELVRAEDDIAD